MKALMVSQYDGDSENQLHHWHGNNKNKTIKTLIITLKDINDILGHIWKGVPSSKYSWISQELFIF